MPYGKDRNTMASPIEWLGKDGETWSPGVGCQEGGCEVGGECWALKMAHRHAHNPTLWHPEKYARVVTDECVDCHGPRQLAKRPYSGRAFLDVCPTCDGTGLGPLRWTGDIEYFDKRLEIPLHWRRPRRVGVWFMGDPFAAGVETKYLKCVLETIVEAHWHTFIVLTKNPERMKFILDRFCYTINDKYPTAYIDDCVSGQNPTVPNHFVIPNLLTGISAGDQAHLDERVPILLQIPGRHVISLEPMTGPIVNLSHGPGYWLNLIEEVYLGGGSKPLHPAWVRQVRDDCKAAGVKFWLKNWGEWLHRSQVPEPWPQEWDEALYRNRIAVHQFDDDSVAFRIGKARAGRTLDGEVHDGEER